MLKILVNGADWIEKCGVKNVLINRLRLWFDRVSKSIAAATVFTKSQLQLCVVPIMRHSLAFFSLKDRKAVANNWTDGQEMADACPELEACPESVYDALRGSTSDIF
jgi:transposase-like protein